MTTNEKRREIVRNSQAKRRAEFKAKGLCIQCGNQPPAKGKTLCDHCLTKQRQYSRKYYLSKKDTMHNMTNNNK